MFIVLDNKAKSNGPKNTPTKIFPAGAGTLALQRRQDGEMVVVRRESQ